MNAIKRAKQLIESNPDDPQASLLVDVVRALQNETPLPLSKLYEADLRIFDLMLDIVKEWRLDRYYAKTGRLLDMMQHVDHANRESTASM